MNIPVFLKQNALAIQYRKPREGPPSFLVWEPGKSYICMDARSVLKAVKWPAYTATGKRLREWLDEVEQATPQETDAPRES